MEGIFLYFICEVLLFGWESILENLVWKELLKNVLIHDQR